MRTVGFCGFAARQPRLVSSSRVFSAAALRVGSGELARGSLAPEARGYRADADRAPCPQAAR
jgi:hypothetical protein